MAPLDVLLAAPPSRLILSSLIAHATAVKAQAAESNRRIAHQAAEIATLQDASANLKSRITELEAEIAALKQENVAANQTIRDLEHQLVDVRDGYQHKIDALRSRIRGVLRGQLTRWIETALEAARSEPPFTLAIQQRLEDALKLVETEVQWLQPSA